MDEILFFGMDQQDKTNMEILKVDKERGTFKQVSTCRAGHIYSAFGAVKISEKSILVSGSLSPIMTVDNQVTLDYKLFKYTIGARSPAKILKDFGYFAFD